MVIDPGGVHWRHDDALTPRDPDRIILAFTKWDEPAGENLAAKFQATTQGVWEWKLEQPLDSLPAGTLMVSVADRQGNVTRIERKVAVGK